MEARNFFSELKRRNVYRAAVAYGVVAWFLTQLTTQVFPFFEIPNAAVRFVVIALAIGFPIAMSLAWLYELTPEGIVRTDDLDPAHARSIQRSTGRLLDFIIIGVLLLVIAMLIYQRSPFPNFARKSILDKTIAVLPFENLSGDPENAFFADGVQDEILTDLSKIADLKVISRSSVLQFKNAAKRNLREIAAALGVVHILEGSVQRAGNRVRVNAQLIDTRSDHHVWADTFDRDLADVFAIQSEIAKAIAEQLHAKISPSEKAAIEKSPTVDVAAYGLFLRARGLYLDSTDVSRAKEKLPEAVRLLEQVLARDPSFVSAWCLLANVHGTFYFQGHDVTPGRLEKINAATEAALRADPKSGEAHLARALYFYRGFRDFGHARQELAKARETLPNDPEVLFFSGVFDYRQGDWESATRRIEQAVDLDPRNLLYVQQMALCYQPQRRYADETRMWERALAIVPGDAVSRLGRAIVPANARGDMKPYHDTIAALLAEDPAMAREFDDPMYGLRERDPAVAARLLRNYPDEGTGAYGVKAPRAYWEGVIARWQGDKARAMIAFGKAREVLAQTVRENPDFAAALGLLGSIDAGLDRKEDAIREGQRACELMPMTKDAVDGVGFVVQLAQIYAWVGEKDRAVEQLAAALKVANDCHYGELLLHPHWDALRGHPGFEKLVASQAPK
jgi:TolB-like protein/cytochrome c-type biogenesis protein CcmH/NrfG